MKDDLIFKPNSLFESVTHNKEDESWYFVFSDKIGFYVQAFWRLLIKNNIALVSTDHGHQFGLPKPKDLIKDLNLFLAKKCLFEIIVKKNTSDLVLNFSDGITLEIYISSTGYESYNFSIDDKIYLGLGSGEFALREPTDDPTLFTAKKL